MLKYQKRSTLKAATSKMKKNLKKSSCEVGTASDSEQEFYNNNNNNLGKYIK